MRYKNRTPEGWYEKKLDDLLVVFKNLIRTTTRFGDGESDMIIDCGNENEKRKVIEKENFLLEKMSEILIKDAEYDKVNFDNHLKIKVLNDWIVKNNIRTEKW